jgi:two-component system, NarL family, nitrate/nitrite response regulator NarL
LTVHETDDVLLAALQEGARGFLLKSVSGEQLLASLRALDREELAISRKMMSHVVDSLTHSRSSWDETEDLLARLSPRENDVLKVLAAGDSNDEIAHRLFLSENTVKHHIHSIFEKLGIRSRQEAIRIVRRFDLQRRNPGIELVHRSEVMQDAG